MAELSLRNTRGWLIFALDVVALFIIICLVNPSTSILKFGFVTLFFICALFVASTYERNLDSGSPRLPIRTFLTCILTGAIFWALFGAPFSSPNIVDNQSFLILTLTFGVCATLNRYFLNKLYHLNEQRKKILYLGYSKQTEELLSELAILQESRQISIVTDRPDVISDELARKLDITPTDALKMDWDQIIVDPQFEPNSSLSFGLIDTSSNQSNVLSLDQYYENFLFMINTSVANTNFLFATKINAQGNRVSSVILKRALDIILSIALIIITLPVTLLSATLIKLTSAGPVLFQQQRVGNNGNLFYIYKLRTMVREAELNGPQWARENDDRVTRVGSFLRRSRIDELPQCINIIMGDMSFVGPRPERPEFTNKLVHSIPFYDVRHCVKPGLTGWAQINYKYGASNEDSLRKLKYDLYYIKNHSLLLDLNILLRTILVIFGYKGR